MSRPDSETEAWMDELAEHRFATHQSSFGDKCVCGWTSHDTPHSTHQGLMLLAAGYAVERLPEPLERDTCVSCATELTPVSDDGSATCQYDNALEVSLSGGYGMFFDNIDCDHHVFLCHDCAHTSRLALPWLNRLIQPERSHAHGAEFWEYNNGHLGWDKPTPAVPTQSTEEGSDA